jgi:dUTP pyrophosphatase
MDTLRVKIKRLRPNAVLPRYAHGPGEDAGLDLHSAEDVRLQAGVPTLIKTGLSIELPTGFEAQIRPRSGLALKHGVTVLNSPGTLDPGYRGEVGVILLWNGHNPTSDTFGTFEINKGDRIAQMVVARYVGVEWAESELSQSSRGDGGFGSSGV